MRRWFVLFAASVLCAGCGEADFDPVERALLSTLGNPPPPPADISNELAGNADAEAFGQKLFFDPGFSGKTTGVDSLGRPVTARAAKDQPVNLSCASCHSLRGGGSDHESVPNHVAVGAGWTAANALAVINAAYYDLMFWNGRADSLWGMIIPVIESNVSMNGNRLALAWRIAEAYASEYVGLFEALPLVESKAEAERHCVRTSSTADAPCDPKRCARVTDGEGGLICPQPGCYEHDTGTCLQRFPLAGKPGRAAQGVTRCSIQPDPDEKPPEPFGDAYDCMKPEDRAAITQMAVNVAKAIAAYELKLVVHDSLFDQHLRGAARMSDAAIRGARLFVGKAACIECHRGSMLTDQGFHNIGVPQAGAGVPTEADCLGGRVPCDCVTSTTTNCQPWGAFDGLQKLRSNPFRRDAQREGRPQDLSRSMYYSLPIDDSLKGAWRTPSLRNVALTAPYMHNGSLPTLEAVIDHYDRGGSDTGAAPQEKSKKLRPLGLDAREKADLVEFLRALTGDPLPEALTSAPPP